MKLFDAFIPAPLLVFHIEVTPEVSYSRRRGEISSLEDAERMWKSSRDLLTSIEALLSSERVVTVDNSGSLKSSKQRVLDAMTRTLDTYFEHPQANK